MQRLLVRGWQANGRCQALALALEQPCSATHRSFFTGPQSSLGCPHTHAIQTASRQQAHQATWSAWQQWRSFTPSCSTWMPVDVKIPQMGESVTEGTIASVLKKPGDTVKEDDIIAQIETDKVTIDVKYTGKESGTITQLLIKEQDVVSAGMVAAVVEPGAAGTAPQAAAPAPSQAAAPPAGPEPTKPFTPTIPTSLFPTSLTPKTMPVGPSVAQPPTPAPPPAAPKPSPAAPGEPMPQGPRPERRVKMTRLRQRVAERLKGAQNTYAMLSTFNEVDMTSLMDMRNTYKDAFLEKHGVKLGFMSAFVKAAAFALKEVPAVNAVIDGDEIVYRDYVDISIAVATPKGLVVPVLRSADQLSFAECEKTLTSMGKKARDGTISIDDMAGGTFTISNGGVYGSLLSTPIINPPQSAILGMHAINQRAVVINGVVVPRPIMNIALTYDHRLIDGREGVTFLKRIKEVVEDPRRLLIDC